MFLSRHGPGRSGPERAHPHVVPDGAAVLPHVRRVPERLAGHVPAAVRLPLSRPLTQLISSGADAPGSPGGTSTCTGAGAGPAVTDGGGHSGCTA